IPNYRGVRRIISCDGIGSICAVRFDVMQNMLLFLPTDHWLYDGKQAGGGIVISVAVHRIDLLRYLLGEITQVSAKCQTINPAFINGAEDYATALLEFENGAIGEMFATYSGFRMPWSEGFMIFGTNGTIHAMPQHGSYQGPAMLANQDSANVY